MEERKREKGGGEKGKKRLHAAGCCRAPGSNFARTWKLSGQQHAPGGPRAKGEGRRGGGGKGKKEKKENQPALPQTKKKGKSDQGLVVASTEEAREKREKGREREKKQLY